MKLQVAVGALILACLMGCGALVTGSASMVAVIGGSGGGAAVTTVGMDGLSSRVPAVFVPWIMRSAGQCQPPLTPALLSAQLDAESGLNPDVGDSPVGAQGPAQIMPANQGLIHDDDGNGVASAHDVGDAVMAMGRMMCSFLPRLSVYSGDELLRLMLASYNAGPFAVLPSVCAKATQVGACRATIPPYPETQNYVAKIMASMASFQAPAAAGAGGWTQPIAGSFVVGATFQQVGSHWAWCGWHTGYDYSVPIGTNVLAAHSGTVIHAAWGGESGGTGSAYGNQVIVDHGGGVRSYYDHLSAFGVKPGQQVTTGQVLGLSGVTGNVTGPHLHFEISIGQLACANFVDPYAYIKAHAQAAPDQAGDTSTLSGKAVAAARTQLGVPYVYGGGDLNGPTSGGLDCSSLVRYAWFQASGGKITLPRVASDQMTATAQIDKADLQPGDLLFFQTAGPGDWSHVGMYIGGGKMIHAPRPGKSVEVVALSGYYSSIPTIYRRVQA